MVSFTLCSAQGLEFKESSSYGKEITCSNSEELKKAIQEKMKSLKKHQTWELVSKPAGQKVVDNKWLF